MECLIFKTTDKPGTRFAIETDQPQDVNKELVKLLLGIAHEVSQSIALIRPLVKETNHD